MPTNITLTGIYTPGLPETRNIALVQLTHNNIEYSWKVYIPQEVNIQEYIESQLSTIQQEIDTKEKEWETLSPKHRLITDFTGETFKQEITKDEIVCPEIPDYYAKRRDAYPPLGEQLDAIWKGIDSAEFLRLQETIKLVKQTYPKTLV